MRPYSSFFAVALLFFVLVTGIAGADDARVCDQVLKRIERNRPANVTTLSITKSEELIVVSGNSSNANAIAQFIENIKSDGAFNVPVVKHVQMQSPGPPPLYEFELSVSLRDPNACSRPDDRSRWSDLHRSPSPELLADDDAAFLFARQSASC